MADSESLEEGGGGSGAEEQLNGGVDKENNNPPVAGSSDEPMEIEDSSCETVKKLIWKRYRRMDNDDAKCNFCPKRLKTSNETGMERHLQSLHEKEFKVFATEKSALLAKKTEKQKKKAQPRPKFVVQPGKMKADFFKPRVDPELQDRWDGAMVDFIGESYTTFRQMSSPMFQKLIRIANPKIKVKSRHTLSRHVTKKAHKVLNDIVKVLKVCKPDLKSVAFTTDMWTDKENRSFLSLTLHTIDKLWRLQRLTPFCKHFAGRHKGVAIAIKLDNMIKTLTLDDPDLKRFAVNDNAANAKKAIKESELLEQYLCDNHTLQLAVEDTFKNASVVGTRMDSVIQKGKSMATLTKQSGPANEELKAKCKEVGIKFTKIKSKNDTRWNSQLINFKSIWKLKPAIEAICVEDESGNWSSKRFTKPEWKLMKGAIEVLELVLLVTKAWEVEVTPTINTVIEQLYSLNCKLNAFIEDPTNCMYGVGFAEVLLSEVENRFPQCGSSNPIRCVANFLDPAFKGAHLLKFKKLVETKAYIEEKWGSVEKNQVEELEVETLSPTMRLLQTLDGEQENMDDLKKEILRYESMQRLAVDGDRLMWWKSQEENLPRLADIAREVLAIPCSSSKSERVFSIGGQVVTPRRCRLNADKVEALVIIKDNSERLKEFTIPQDNDKNGWKAFELVEVLVEKIADCVDDEGEGSAIFEVDTPEDPVVNIMDDSSSSDGEETDSDEE